MVIDDLAYELAANLQPPETESLRYVLRNAAFALGPQPPIEWIIDRLFSAGSVSLAVGAPGSKKTYSMLSAAVCVASGKPWLGEFTTRQKKVLIVDEESGERRLSRRLGEVLRGEFANDETPIEFVSLAQFNLRDPNEAILLRALIESTEAKFIVIDALADIMPGADENAVKDVQPVFLRLRKIAEETGAAIVVIHHANKMGDYRGSTAISGAVDLLLMIESKSGSPNIDLETKKARDIEPFKFAAQIHFSDEQAWLTASEVIQGGPRYSKSQEYVNRVLKERGPMALPDIMAFADICSGEAARAAVYSLAKMDVIYRTNPGAVGQGIAAIYAIKNGND